MRRGIRERADDVGELHERPGPAVGQQQRGGVGLWRADVQEVNILAVDFRNELREGVQLRLGGPPVVIFAPVANQLPQVLHRDSAFPAGAKPGRPAGIFEPSPQVVECVLRDVYLERPHRELRINE